MKDKKVSISKSIGLGVNPEKYLPEQVIEQRKLLCAKYGQGCLSTLECPVRKSKPYLKGHSCNEICLLYPEVLDEAVKQEKL